MISDDYFAGMFDGDGYVGVVYNKNQNWYNVRASISNVDTNMLQMIQSKYGGKLDYKHYSNKNHRNWFVLKWGGKEAIELLKKVKHRLIVKKDQAELASTFVMGYGSDKKKQRYIYEELMKMKRKEFDPPKSSIDKAKNRNREMIKKKILAKKLRSEGFTQDKIGEKIGVSQEMISKYLSSK